MKKVNGNKDIQHRHNKRRSIQDAVRTSHVKNRRLVVKAKIKSDVVKAAKEKIGV